MKFLSSYGYEIKANIHQSWVKGKSIMVLFVFPKLQHLLFLTLTFLFVCNAKSFVIAIVFFFSLILELFLDRLAKDF